MEINKRRLPSGIQSFEEIRQGGYVYVDKTDLVWQLAHADKFNYLSRPRRFGKSVLIDTLECYFSAKKELFEGLKIMELETEWRQYPVMHFDMSEAGATTVTVCSFFNRKFEECEEKYDIHVKQGKGLADRFVRILQTMSNDGKEPVVVLIDEYDSPLQHSWHTPEHEAVTAVYRQVFACLKSCTKYEKFVFLTGITKFTQISLFSVLNNLTNISFMPQYAAICGITKDEISENFLPELEVMAEKNGWTVQETLNQLKSYYDGYHFCAENMVDIYNPFSLVRALADGRLRNYWSSSGATNMLPKFVEDMELKIRNFDNCSISSVSLETSDVTGGPEMFLYQSGYLTIKAYEDEVYYLRIPNMEVRQALYDVVLPALTLRKQGEMMSAQGNLRGQMNRGILSEAMKVLKALIADVPYSNKKLECMDMEERYRFIISSIFYSIGLRVEVERMMANGRIDLVAWTRRFVYVIELKLSKNGGIAAAEQQIRDHLYAEPFKGEGREVVALAIELDDQGKGMLEWRRVE